MANAPYLQGTVTVSSTATLLATTKGSGGIYVQNGATAIVLGGSNVTATGATAGISLAASAAALLPTSGALHDLYAITASGTSNVAFLHPS